LDVRGKWRKLHNEELNELHSSPNTFWVIKLGRMRWVGHVACMEESRDHLEDTGINGGIILR